MQGETKARQREKRYSPFKRLVLFFTQNVQRRGEADRKIRSCFCSLLPPLRCLGLTASGRKEGMGWRSRLGGSAVARAVAALPPGLRGARSSVVMTGGRRKWPAQRPDRDPVPSAQSASKAACAVGVGFPSS